MIDREPIELAPQTVERTMGEANYQQINNLDEMASAAGVSVLEMTAVIEKNINEGVRHRLGINNESVNKFKEEQ